jgi:hypothetical protein
MAFNLRTIFGLAVALYTGTTYADTIANFGPFESWGGSMISRGSDGGPICYVSSGPEPKSTTEFLEVTYLVRSSISSVILTTGSGYKAGKVTWLDIDGAKFDLRGGRGGMAGMTDRIDPVATSAIIKAMLAGHAVVVHGTNTEDKEYADRYSLKGFPEAYAAIEKACNIPAIPSGSENQGGGK